MNLFRDTDAATFDDQRRYLLGRLDGEARDALEVELLADDDAYAAMLVAEDDLIDDYARGVLGDDDRAAFEARVLPRPGVGERLAFARSLAAAAAAGGVTAEEAAPSASPGGRFGRWLAALLAPAPALRLAPVAAALLLAVATGWLAWNGARMADRLQGLEAANAQLAGERSALAAESDALAAELAAARQAAAAAGADDVALAAAERRIAELEAEMVALRRLPERPRRVAASFVLSLATRGDEVTRLVVPEAADAVRLQLDTAGDAAYHDSFQARLLAPGGGEAWSARGLAADAETGTVDVELAAELMPPGRYEVLLDGVSAGGAPELVGAYEFEVRRP